MDHHFLNKESRFVVVDSTSVVKPVALSILRSLGYKHISGIERLKEAVSLVEQGDVAWVLCHLDAKAEVNGFTFLRWVTKLPVEKRPLVSMLVDAEEMHLVPLIFTLGALSYHEKPVTQNSLRAAFKDAAQHIRANNSTAHAAAISLRQYLRQSKKYQELTRLEDSMVQKLGSGNGQFLHLAEAQLLQGQNREGAATLYQSILIDPSTRDRAEALSEQYLNASLASQHQGAIVRKAVLVDHDQAEANALKLALQKLGAEEVQIFDNSTDALEFLRSHLDFDVLITEWKLRGIPGHAFIQRVRLEIRSPILIMLHTSLLTSDDGTLLKEMGVAKVIPKPLSEEFFMTSLIAAFRDDVFPAEAEAMIRKIRTLLSSDSPEEAFGLASKLFGDPTIGAMHKDPIRAEIAYYNERYGEAIKIATEVIKRSGPNVFLLNLLGKCFMATSDFSNALRCFDKAKSLSPNNIERLCRLAEAHSEMGDTANARVSLHKAQQVAKDAPIVGITAVKIAANSRDTVGANQIIEQLGNANQLVSFWNNQAVSYAKSNRVEKAIEIYKKALDSLPGRELSLRVIISYNLALAFAKQGRSHEVNALLNQVKDARDHPIYKKIQALHGKAIESIKTGKTIVLNQELVEVKNTGSSQGLDLDTILSATPAIPGEYCLLGVFATGEDFDESVNGILALEKDITKGVA